MISSPPASQSAAFLATLLIMGLPRVEAQALPQPPPNVESMPIRFGPLGLNPALSITEVGVDSNIFNEPENPKQDFTATIVPRLDARLRTGGAILSMSNSTGFVYYREHVDQRSVNYVGDGRVDVDLGRLQPFAAASFQDTHERFNSELDARVPRTQWKMGAGAQVVVGSRASVTVSARRSTLDFDSNAVFEGVSLSRTLDSHTDTFDGAMQFVVTPLTTVTVLTSAQRDRFEQSPDRDADTFRLVPGVQFDPIALVRGSFAMGYRRFTPLDASLPDFRGMVMDGSLGYTLPPRTRFDVTLKRDLQYSFEQHEPYYATTGGRLTITQQIAGPYDVQLIGGRERLAYRGQHSADPTRTDTVGIIGAGFGYRLRDGVRFAVNADRARRSSDRPDREYRRTRVFASFTYGL